MVDGVRVLLGSDWSDGIGGTSFRKGLSDVVSPTHAERLCALFGHMGARVVGVDTVSPYEVVPAPVEAVEAAPLAPAPSIPQPVEPFARASRAHRGR